MKAIVSFLLASICFFAFSIANAFSGFSNTDLKKCEDGYRKVEGDFRGFMDKVDKQTLATMNKMRNTNISGNEKGGADAQGYAQMASDIAAEMAPIKRDANTCHEDCGKALDKIQPSDPKREKVERLRQRCKDIFNKGIQAGGQQQASTQGAEDAGNTKDDATNSETPSGEEGAGEQGQGGGQQGGGQQGGGQPGGGDQPPGVPPEEEGEKSCPEGYEEVSSSTGIQCVKPEGEECPEGYETIDTPTGPQCLRPKEETITKTDPNLSEDEYGDGCGPGKIRSTIDTSVCVTFCSRSAPSTIREIYADQCSAQKSARVPSMSESSSESMTKAILAPSSGKGYVNSDGARERGSEMIQEGDHCGAAKLIKKMQMANDLSAGGVHQRKAANDLRHQLAEAIEAPNGEISDFELDMLCNY